jgi:hypothetical protein
MDALLIGPQQNARDRGETIVDQRFWTNAALREKACRPAVIAARATPRMNRCNPAIRVLMKWITLPTERGFVLGFKNDLRFHHRPGCEIMRTPTVTGKTE